jgi:hypothetical protein
MPADLELKDLDRLNSGSLTGKTSARVLLRIQLMESKLFFG